MDYETLRETLRTTLDEIAFRIDEDTQQNISIIHKAQEDLKNFLEENTAISDDEKAKHYSRFLTDTITGVTIQAINIAGQAPLMSVQAETMRAESAQKIISMQNEDKATANKVAVEVAKAKADIETLMPAQVRKIDAEILSLAKDALLKEKEIALREAELPLKEAQTQAELKKIDLMSEEITLKQAELPLKEAQLEAELKKIAILEAEIPLKEAQLEAELQKIELMQAELPLKEVQTEIAQVEVKLKEREIELKTEEIKKLVETLAIEKDKLALMEREVEIKFEEAIQKRVLTENQAMLVNQQAHAVGASLDMQYQIEEARNQKDISVAEIYVGSR